MQSVPSKEEIQKATEEISTIEQEIIETELQLDALRKSLFERKLWIAPIRKVPHKILSLVFAEASKANWKAPLVLQSVCRRWRDVVVDSPEAWTFIPLSKYIFERRSELISLFLEHSRNTPLHVSVEDDSLLGYMELLANSIECIYLNIPNSLLDRYLRRGHAFRRLERLRINGWEWHSAPPTGAPQAWDMLLFPNLKILDIKTQSPSLLREISAAPEFPAIRYLKVICRHSWGLHDILTKCATSLESFDLVHLNRESEGLDREYNINIHFPRLRYLRVSERSRHAESCFRVKASTPNLQAYLVTGHFSTLNAIKVDTDNVILLLTLHTPDLSRYRRLVTLCLGWGDRHQEEVITAVECLRDNPNLCPDLASIEYRGEMTQARLVKAKDAVLARGRATGQTIQLVEGTTEIWEERAQMFRKLQPCGDHMPCNL